MEFENLRHALESGDTEKAIGIYRLADTTGKLQKLPPSLLADLAMVLENAQMELESAHLFRLAAEKTTDAGQSSVWRFHAACLLLGPAFRPEMALGILRSLAEDQHDAQVTQKAQQLVALYENGDMKALGDFLKAQGVRPPEAWSEQVLSNNKPSRLEGPSRSFKTPKFLSLVFFISLFTWLAGGFMKDRLAGVDRTYPQLNSAPRQVKLSDPKPERLRRGDLNITLHPLFAYHICGMVVSVNTYSTLGMRYQDLFERDFCMIWGSNISSGVYKAPGSAFEHHGNVCYFKYGCNSVFNGNELSNNHIFSLDDELMDELRSINKGDQICMDGKLVDVAAVPAKATAGMLPGITRIHTSTVRTDKGMGACEILLVENLDILARANPLWHILSTMGFWLSVASLLAIVILFIKR